MNTISRCIPVAALVLCPTLLAGQYRHERGDTLRYEESTSGQVTMDAPDGTIDVRTQHDARIALTASAPDEVIAWFEALALSQTGMGESSQPATDAVLGQPYTLAFSPLGVVETRDAPALPPEVARLTDLTHQFDDFFISLPSSGLRVGSEWADTLEHDRAGRPSDTFRSRRIRTYRVERDTTVNGQAAFVVAVRQTVSIEGSSPLEGQPGSAAIALSGTEEGNAVFSPASGRLVARHRSGTLVGELSVDAGGSSFTMPQTYRYESRLSLVQ